MMDTVEKHKKNVQCPTVCTKYKNKNDKFVRKHYENR